MLNYFLQMFSHFWVWLLKPKVKTLLPSCKLESMRMLKPRMLPER